jgi:hypothetical protein
MMDVSPFRATVTFTYFKYDAECPGNANGWFSPNLSIRPMLACVGGLGAAIQHWEPKCH